MTFTPQPRPEPPASGGLRQYQADFLNGVLSGLNADVRPDALVLDPLTAYTLGPVAQGDGSQGPIAFAWRVRVMPDGAVMLSRENDARNAWGAESLLFTISGVLPTEVDLTFEQAGRVVFVAERPTGAGGSPEVWIYYLNPLIPGFVFQSFGPGRTPRAILDNPARPTESDVLVAYLNPVSDRLELRQQRDRYLTAYAAPISPVAGYNVEEMLWTADNRLRIILSKHNVSAGTYTVELLDSTLYPFVLRPEDGARPLAPVVLNTSVLRRALLSYGPQPFGQPNISEDGIVQADGARPSAPIVLNTSTLTGGGLIVIDATSTPARLPAEDGARPGAPVVLASSTLDVPLILIFPGSTPYQLPATDAVRPSAPSVLNSSTLQDTLIVITGTGNPRLPPEDAFRPSAPAVLNTSTLA